ncbi:MAG: hypothetical protein ABJE63_04500 [Lentilitoribacter sp.]
MTKKNQKGRWGNHLLFAAIALSGISPAYAQENAVHDDLKIMLELNKLTTQNQSCELTFLVENKMITKVKKLSLEFAFLDEKGQLSKLATLNFGDLVSGRPKIAQFGLTDMRCEDLSKIFINSASECDSISADDCIGVISKTNKTSVKF